MNHRTRRWMAFLLALCLLAGLSPVRAEEAEITISSVEDLLAFSKNCALDTWSQGKTVRLTADLDLKEAGDFTPIPTFGGTFLGEGHRISNLRISAAGSNIGLFRYLQAGALVQDLNVSGSVRPSGSAANVGGIAGNNAGTVRGCKFTGVVEGVSSTGGIAGRNLETGELAGCNVSGSVSGESCTGGITGRNLGTVLQCGNAASVNTAAPSEKAMDMDALSNPLEDSGEEGGILKTHSDTGGIAGESSGIVYSCVNTGAVGYPHVGYNVGGIAGRQSGHLSGCENRGKIYGRKDAGGIVGQAEPDVALSPDSDTLGRLREELDTLDRLIDQALARADGSADDISNRLSGISNITGAARDHTKTLLEHVSDFTDENLDSINSLTAAATKALDDLTPALDALSNASDRTGTLADRLGAALNDLGAAAGGGQDVSDSASAAVNVFRQAGDTLSAAVREFRAAVSTLRRAVVVQDQAAVDQAAENLTAALESLAGAIEQAGQAVDAIHDTIGHFPSLIPIAIILKEQLAPALKSMGSAIRQAGKSLRSLNANTDLDWTKVRAALSEAGNGFQTLENASQRLNAALAALQETLGGLGGLSGDLGGAVKGLADAANLASPIGSDLERAFRILKTAANDLAEDGPVQFTPLGETVRESGRGLFDSLTDLSQAMKDLDGAVSSAGDRLTADLRAVSRQFNRVFAAILDAMSDFNGGTGTRELLEDTSDEDIAFTRSGKVENCRNEGPVDADRNVGGIAGAMSIEYDLDPENDLSLSLGSAYETKAVLLNCVNHGAVTAKKDCAGGMAGRMDLGAVRGCESYGPVTSTSGGSVGGVAGYSSGVIRESFAKCALSGGDDIGGIAGRAGRLRNCYAIATVLEGTERVGAIAGSGELSGMENNLFVDTGVAGVDGVSYTGIAGPVDFEELRALPDIPAEFSAFTLTLKADEKIIQQIPFNYGQDLRGVKLPPAPEKEGFYAEWPEFDTSGRNSDVTLEAVYQPWVTLLASRETEGKQAVALAEGQFTDKVILHAKPGTNWMSPEMAAEAEAGIVRGLEITLDYDYTDLEPEDETTIRLLNHTGGKAKVLEFRYDGKDPHRVDAEENGSYLIVTMRGTRAFYAIVPAQESGMVSTVLLVLGVLLALLVLLQVIKRRKNKPSKKTAAT